MNHLWVRSGCLPAILHRAAGPTARGNCWLCPKNDALFSLLGTIYGGDGRTTFGLPDMRGRIPIHAGSGPGQSPRRLGAKGGTEKETLTVNQLPAHNHIIEGSSGTATTSSPGGKVLAQIPHRRLVQHSGPIGRE